MACFVVFTDFALPTFLTSSVVTGSRGVSLVGAAQTTKYSCLHGIFSQRLRDFDVT